MAHWQVWRLLTLWIFKNIIFQSFIIQKERKNKNLSTAEIVIFQKGLREKKSKQTILDKEMRQFQIKNTNLNEVIL